jgi:hypothetical protein
MDKACDGIETGRARVTEACRAADDGGIDIPRDERLAQLRFRPSTELLECRFMAGCSPSQASWQVVSSHSGMAGIRSKQVLQVPLIFDFSNRRESTLPGH